MTSDLVLYNSAISGNAYKVRLLLSHLGLKFQRIEFNVDDGSTRTAEFLAKNPNGKVPTIRLADGSHLFESNAILYYFAEGTPILAGEQARPRRRDAVDVLRAIQPRALHRRGPPLGRASRQDAQNEPQLPMRTERGYHALSVMESRLKDHAWFAGDAYSIADIALYAYTHVAHEGGFDLARYPGIRAWLARVASQPGHIRITD